MCGERAAPGRSQVVAWCLEGKLRDAGQLFPAGVSSMWRYLSSTSCLRAASRWSAPLLLVLLSSPSRAADIDDGVQLTVEQAFMIAVLDGEVNDATIRLHRLMRGQVLHGSVSASEAAFLRHAAQLLTLGKLMAEHTVASAYDGQLPGTPLGRLLTGQTAWDLGGDGVRCLAHDVRREPVDGSHSSPTVAASVERVGFRVEYVCIAPHLHKMRGLARLITAMVQEERAPTLVAFEQVMLSAAHRDDTRPWSMSGSILLSSDAQGRNWMSEGANVSGQFLTEAAIVPTQWTLVPATQAASVHTAVQELLERTHGAGEPVEDLTGAIATHLLLRFPDVLRGPLRQDAIGFARALSSRSVAAECRVQEVYEGEDHYEQRTVRRVQAELQCALPTLGWVPAPIDADGSDAIALVERYRQFLERATETIANSPATLSATALDFHLEPGSDGGELQAESGAVPKMLLEATLPGPLLKELGGLVLNSEPLHPELRYEQLDARNLSEFGRVHLRRFTQALRAATRTE